MTVAAVQATVLRDGLNAGGVGLPRRVDVRAARMLDAPWDMGMGNDVRYAHVDARPRHGSTMIGRYVDRVTRAAGAASGRGPAVPRRRQHDGVPGGAVRPGRRRPGTGAGRPRRPPDRSPGPRGRVDVSRLSRALRVRPGEGRVVAFGAAMMVAAEAGGAFGQSGIDALFFATAQRLPGWPRPSSSRACSCSASRWG